MRRVHSVSRLAFLLTALSTAPWAIAQEVPPTPAPRPSAAELQLRDAWWAESGANDLSAALRGYLAAVAAEGPATVRARALLWAGRLQQRLGQSEQALASFRRLLVEFAAETELVGDARTHLRELTAVDLRQTYDEWYERRLFSEEVQLVILGKLEALAANLGAPVGGRSELSTLQDERRSLVAGVMSFGRGAVPALRKAAVGRQQAMASMAIDLLVRLGEVPPWEALRASTDWSTDLDALRLLLAQPGGGVASTDEPRSPWHVRCLLACRRGPIAAAELLLSCTSPAPEELQPLAAVLLEHEESRRMLLAALSRTDVALRVRQAIERVLCEGEPWADGLTTAEWLAAGEQPLLQDLCLVSLHRAARGIRADEPELLDRMLARLSAAVAGGPPASEAGQAAARLVTAFVNGLNEHPAVELLPWTPERLQALLLAAACTVDADLRQVLQSLRRQPELRRRLAERLFAAPVALATAYQLSAEDASTLDALRRHFEVELETEGDTVAFARQWHAAVLAAATAAWPAQDEASRLASLLLLPAVVSSMRDTAAMRPFLEARANDTSEPVRVAITRALENLPQ